MARLSLCPNLTKQENLGHDLFYGSNDSGLNRLVDNGNGGLTPKMPAAQPATIAMAPVPPAMN